MIQNLAELNIPWEEREVVSRSGPYTIESVRTQWDYELEGFFLAHCLGTKDADKFGRHHQVFSVRDADSGVPHATILCVRPGKWSPYGGCRDLGTKHSMRIDGKKLRVLQVRGRFDEIARPEFMYLTAMWFQAQGGKLDIPLAQVLRYCAVKGDDDEEYHYDLLFDDSRNGFTWSHTHTEKAKTAREDGTSL